MPSGPALPRGGNPRGRPRDPAIDEAIFDAANALIAGRGYDRVTIGELAKRAGVPKSTIYRRFGSREEVLLAAARETSRRVGHLPDTGNIRDDLITFVRMQCQAFTDRPGIAQLALAAVNNADLAGVLRGLADERRAATKRVLQRGIDRGELDEDVNIDLLVDLVRGAAWSRFLERLPLEPDLPEQVVGYLLDGVARSAGR